MPGAGEPGNAAADLVPARYRAAAVMRCRCGHEKRISRREMVRQFGAVAVRKPSAA